MIIAKQKKETNIAEYVLYMFHIEDIIRANGFDIQKIENNIVSHYDQPREVKKQIRQWYEGLINMMQEEKITETGHLQFIKNTISDIYDLHLRLLDKPDESRYHQLYFKALPNLKAFKSKTRGTEEHDMELLFHALYTKVLLKLQKKQISTETQEAFQTFSNLLAMLSKKYKDREKGDLNIS